MATQILHDFERDITTLYEPDMMRSFGPVVVGRERYELMVQFVANAPVDPAVMLPHELDDLWGAFHDTMMAGATLPPADQQPEETVPPTADTMPPDDVSPPTGETPEVAAEAAAGDPPTTQAVVETIKCPTCDGFKTVAEGVNVVQCPTCRGRGVLNAVQ